MPTECESNALIAPTTSVTEQKQLLQQERQQQQQQQKLHKQNSNKMENEMSTSQTSNASSNGSCHNSKKTAIISPDPTAYVTKARVTRPTPPPPPYNPMQFVQIKPCNLYQSAHEQLKKAEEVKKIKEIRKEEPEDWQNNLDNWKSSRRKRVEHIIDRVVEVKKLELEEHDRTRRKSKTFYEMIEGRGERAGRGLNKLASLAVYNEDEANDLSDLGIGTSSASGKSSLSDDYDNNSVMSDNVNELQKPIREHNSKQRISNNTTREYISSPGYETSSSTAPASSPDPCEYTYEGAIQDYKQRVSRAASGLTSLTLNKLSGTSGNKIVKNNNTNGTMTSKDSTPERLISNGNTNGGCKESYPPRRGNKIEDRLMGFEVQSPSEEYVEQKKVDVPKIDISKRKEIFENAQQQQHQHFKNANNNNELKFIAESESSENGNDATRISLKDRFKKPNNSDSIIESNKKETSRLPADITSIKQRLQSLEQQQQHNQQQETVNRSNGTTKTYTFADITFVPPLKERLSSLQNAVTKEETRKPPVKLVDARQLEIMKSEEEKVKQALKEIRNEALLPDSNEALMQPRSNCTKNGDTQIVDEAFVTKQDNQLNATIEALAMEEKQLAEAASMVNQIEAEFDELNLNTLPLAPLATSSLNATSLSPTATTNTNETMEYSINEALELALAAIDQETTKTKKLQTIPTTTITQFDAVTTNYITTMSTVKQIITTATATATTATATATTATATTTTTLQLSSISNNNDNNNSTLNNHINDGILLSKNKTDEEKVEQNDVEQRNSKCGGEISESEMKQNIMEMKEIEKDISNEPIYENVYPNYQTNDCFENALIKNDGEEKVVAEEASNIQNTNTANNNNNNNFIENLLDNNDNVNSCQKHRNYQNHQITNCNNTKSGQNINDNNNNNNSQQIYKYSNNNNNNKNNNCNSNNNNNITEMVANSNITTRNLIKNITTTTNLTTPLIDTTNTITDSTILVDIDMPTNRTSPTIESYNNFNMALTQSKNDFGPNQKIISENISLTNNVCTITITTTTTTSTTITANVSTINTNSSTTPITATMEKNNISTAVAFKEPYYQVPKSNEPHYDAPKHLKPIPLYENIEMFFNNNTIDPTTVTINNDDTIQMASINLEPPKEKPPPPPIESPPPFDELDSQTDTYSSDNTYETLIRHPPPSSNHIHYRHLHANHMNGPPHSPAIDQTSLPSPPIKRMNSTKRIKKELRNKRSSFLGLEGNTLDDEDSYLELTIAPPPDMAQLLEEERRLEKQLYIKAGLCDSSDTGESRDSGVSENHSRQSSEHFTNSSEENESHDITPSPLTLETQSPISSTNIEEVIYQNDELLQVAPVTPLLQTVKGNSAESWTESATVAAAATKSLTDATATANAKMISIEEKIREQEEVLRVERELLQLEQEELKRQRENLMLRENMARRELQHGAKMLMSANHRSLQNLQEIQSAALTKNDGIINNGNRNENIKCSIPIHHPTVIGPYGEDASLSITATVNTSVPNIPHKTQQIYANLPNVPHPQYYNPDNSYRKSMSDINELSKRMMVMPTPIPPTKPLRAIQVANNAEQTEFLPRHRHSLNSQQFGGSLVQIAQPIATTIAATTVTRPSIYTNYHNQHNPPSINMANTQTITGNSPITSNCTYDVTKFSQPMYPGQMSRNTLHALSATPKPKYTDGWVQVQNRKSYETNVANDPAWLSAYQQKRKSMPDTTYNSNTNVHNVNNNNTNNNYWLFQEGEQRRLAKQHMPLQSHQTQQQQQNLLNRRSLITSTSNIKNTHSRVMNATTNIQNGKPLPDAIIQTLTERVQSKGLGDRKRNHLDKSPVRTDIHSYYQQYNINNNSNNTNMNTNSNNHNHRNNNGNNNMQQRSNVGQNCPNNMAILTNGVQHHQKQQQQQQHQQQTQDKILSVSGKKKCSHCGDELGRGAAMIIESLLLFYHIKCFKCCVCHVQLGDGLNGTDVRVRNQKLHCQNCYSSDDGIKFSCV